MFPIKCLSLAHVMHLTIMTVCYLQDIDCPPIIRLPARRKSITNFEKMEETLKENESWVRELQHVNVLTGKIDFFCNAMQTKIEKRLQIVSLDIWQMRLLICW